MKMPLLVFLAIVFGLLVAAPFVIIWSLNVLFPFNIKYAFDTWFAVVVILFTAKAFASISVTFNKS